MPQPLLLVGHDRLSVTQWLQSTYDDIDYITRSDQLNDMNLWGGVSALRIDEFDAKERKTLAKQCCFLAENSILIVDALGEKDALRKVCRVHLFPLPANTREWKKWFILHQPFLSQELIDRLSNNKYSDVFHAQHDALLAHYGGVPYRAQTTVTVWQWVDAWSKGSPSSHALWQNIRDEPDRMKMGALVSSLERSLRTSQQRRRLWSVLDAYQWIDDPLMLDAWHTLSLITVQ